MPADRTESLVSVVVPTRNNIRTIEACLASVRAQDYPNLELIVVDNHSADETATIAEQFADRLLVAGPERSAQRNVGIDTARGEWVLWLDSDMILPEHAVSAAMATAQSAGAVGVALPERTVGSGFWSACRALERSCYLNEPLLHNPRLIRRDYLREVGGFDTSMSGPEDTDLRLRMRAHGCRIELAPVLVDHDEGRLTIADVMRKRYYYGRSVPALSGIHPRAVAGQGRTVAMSYVRSGHRLAADPVHAIGMLALRGLEAGAYVLGARRGRRDDVG